MMNNKHKFNNLFSVLLPMSVIIWIGLNGFPGLAADPVKRAILPEVIKPDFFTADARRIFLAQGGKIDVYDRAKGSLLARFGRPGESLEAFRANRNGTVRLWLNAQGPDLIVGSHERLAVYSKEGEYKHTLDVPYMVHELVPLADGYVGCAYHIEVGTGLSTEHILLFDDKFEVLKEIAGSYLGAGSARGFGGPDRRLHYDLFSPFFGYRVTGASIIVASADEDGTIESYDPQGQLRYRFDGPFPAVPIPEDKMTERKERFTETDTYKRYAQLIVLQNRTRYPAFKSIGADGQWVYVFTYQETEAGTEVWILDPSLRLTKKIHVPSSDWFEIVDGAYLYLSQNDAGEWVLFELNLAGLAETKDNTDEAHR